MSSSNVPWIIGWWVTPKLPKEHIFIPPDKKPKGIYPTLRVYFRKWVVHPIKRRLARYYLKFLQAFFSLTVIGITGSAGKTTAKEMLAAILKQKGKTVWSHASVDPIYNIPTTILRCTPRTKYLILEMAVEFPGEMDFYLWLAQPKIGIITNIYQTHTQFFKDINGVAREKRKLVDSLSEDGFAILNRDNLYTRKFDETIKAKAVWFGQNTSIKAAKIRITKSLTTTFNLSMEQNSAEIELPIPGGQFVTNALAATAVGYALGATLEEIKQGLENFSMPEHRMEIVHLKTGAIILDDSYNNNPSAAKEALETLKSIAGKRKIIVVMGDMLELGEKEKQLHEELGREIAKSGVGYFIGVGQLSRYAVDEAKKKLEEKNVWWVEKENQVLPILKRLLKEDTITLIKGSRSIGLDKVVLNLTDL